MSIFSIHWLRDIPMLGIAACVLFTTTPLNAQEMSQNIAPSKTANCFLTDAEISRIKFHYDLDRYMVAGCIVGGIFGAITGMLSLSGINIIASVPYIATGCSLGFLIGGAGIVFHKIVIDPKNPATTPPLHNTW